jgi:LPXTG-site transpeptidase (sortase) family protein
LGVMLAMLAVSSPAWGTVADSPTEAHGQVSRGDAVTTEPTIGTPTTPSPTPAIDPAPIPDSLVLEPSAPVTVSIPSIGVDSPLMDLGLADDGSLEVPPGAHPAGWYTGAPTPGEKGPAIIAGHVDYSRERGVFHELHRVDPGDEVLVERADGTTAVFVVTRREQYAKNAFPTDTVYGNLDHAGLRLITCGGEFDTTARSHRDNIVVFAALDRVLPAEE